MEKIQKFYRQTIPELTLRQAFICCSIGKSSEKSSGSRVNPEILKHVHRLLDQGPWLFLLSLRRTPTLRCGWARFWTWKGFVVCLFHLAGDLGLKLSFAIPKPVPRKLYFYYDSNYLYGDEDGIDGGEEDYFDPEYTLDSEVCSILRFGMRVQHKLSIIYFKIYKEITEMEPKTLVSNQLENQPETQPKSQPENRSKVEKSKSVIFNPVMREKTQMPKFIIVGVMKCGTREWLFLS